LISLVLCRGETASGMRRKSHDPSFPQKWKFSDDLTYCLTRQISIKNYGMISSHKGEEFHEF